MKNEILGGAILAITLVVGGDVSAALTQVWARTHATRSAVDADLASCKLDFLHAPRPVRPTGEGYGAAGYLTAALVADGFEALRQRAFIRHCMYRHGYVQLNLTTGEQAAFEARNGSRDRAAWLDAFYAADLAPRIAAAEKGVGSPLPEGVDEPFVYGGVRLDARNLNVAPGPVVAGEAVLMGTVAHRRTARLRTGVSIVGLYSPHAAAGTVFHQIVYPNDYQPAQTYWCGLMAVSPGTSATGQAKFCVLEGEVGYVLVLATGEAWLSDAPGRTIAPNWQAPKADFSMEVSDTDLIGDMDFRLIVVAVTSSTVSLEAQATRQGKSVTFWSGVLPVSADGKAVLPFWTHRLTLTRDGASVIPAFTPDGDGAGWPPTTPAP